MQKYDIIYEDELKENMSGEFSKKITRNDVESFAEVTGDTNPMHMDDDFAEKTQFHGRIAHGMISAGLISACIGTKIPGPGTIYLGQTLQFKKPAHFDDFLTAQIKVNKIEQKKNFKIATLETTVINQDNKIITQGEAKVIPPQKTNEF